MWISLVLAVSLARPTLAVLLDFNVAQYCEKNHEMDWSYHGFLNAPEHWGALFPKCDKKSSPIRMFSDFMKNERNLRKLEFIQYDNPVIRAQMENDGRMVILKPKDSDKRGILYEGEEYTLQHLQFHFGSTDRPGAEHTINHIRYPMEVQFVHKNAEDKYVNVALLVDVSDPFKNVKHPSVGFYFLMTSVYAQMENNHAFNPILLGLPEITFKGESTKLRYPLVLEALLPENPASFYRYKGTLTTPPCDEAVWCVLKTTTSLGRPQLDIFLGLYSVERKDASPECLMKENYSPAAEAILIHEKEVSASQ